MEKIFIVGAKRTAIGSFGGGFKDVPASKLGAETVKAVLSQSGVSPEAVDQVIIGNILTAGQGMGPGRQVALYAGLPETTPGYSVNMLCGSGMKAAMIASEEISGNSEALIIGGGIENMSQAPYLVPWSVRFGSKLGAMSMEDHMIRDGLTDVFNGYHMGITAENIAEKYGITREEQDVFALESQLRAKTAIEAGKFKDEICPVDVVSRRKTSTVDTDEHPRLDASLDNLAKLRPAFKKEGGTVTAGNASGINDGAAVLMLAGESAVKKYNLNVIGIISGWGQGAVDPAYMGLGPVPAIRNMYKRFGGSLKDAGLIELNEAFAAQSLGVVSDLSEEYGMPKEEILERTNVNGGAIALGHPIGASGARIIVTLLYEMKKRKVQTGIASLCIGGGMGTAVRIELA